MPKVRLLVILLIVATTFVLNVSWRAVGAPNTASLNDSLAQCGEETCCDENESHPVVSSNAAEFPLACCEHEGSCDCQCCRPLLGLVQLVFEQRRVKDSRSSLGYIFDRHYTSCSAPRFYKSTRAPDRPPGVVTPSLLDLRCLIIV